MSCCSKSLRFCSHSSADVFSFPFFSFCLWCCQPHAMALFLWVRISLFISFRKGRTNLLSGRERRCSWPDKWIISLNELCNATNPTHSQNQRNPSQPGMWHPKVKAPCPAQHSQCFGWNKIPGEMHKIKSTFRLANISLGSQQRL